MRSRSTDDARYRSTQRALRLTTERLAAELNCPTADAPPWSDFEWRIARAAAALNGISVLLAGRLRWRGPDHWQEFLQTERTHAQARDALIGELLERLQACLQDHGIAAVGLKGAALRPFNLYAPGERPMGDVDLLVRPEAQGRLTTALANLGYRSGFASRRHAAFEPENHGETVGFGEHPANALKIEAHTQVAEALPVDAVDITDRLWPATPQLGINAYESTRALMLHLLLHAAGNMRAHALRLVQLVDIARLTSRIETCDWPLVAQWWTYPPMALAARYFPGCIPPGALQLAADRCPLLLRRAVDRWDLTRVSWSNLRIHALPGVAWSRSPGEMLRFAVSRALPDRTALSELAVACTVQPKTSQIPWYTLSHPRRIARWLLSRPPRVQTMLSVRAALEGGT